MKDSIQLFNFIRIGLILFSIVLLSSMNIYLDSFKKRSNHYVNKELNFNDCNYLNDSSNLTLCDLIITIKTTKQNHETKLINIIETWYNLIFSKVFIVSDEKDEIISNLTNNKLIETKCDKSHSRNSLICKLTVEFQIFLNNAAKWYCHADDDTYFNVKRLYEILAQYDPMKSWYIGRISISQKMSFVYEKKLAEFSFATGGAGYCLSHGLMLKLAPFVEPKRLLDLSNGIAVPDDVLLGFIIEVLLNTKLTESKLFHSHLEFLGYYDEYNLKEQVSLSYNYFHNNMVNIKSNITNDPTRFKSIHCKLYPKEKICERERNQTWVVS